MYATKQEILTQGMRLMREKGFPHISVEEICRTCNISRGTFYYHFRSKEDILLEYVKTISDTRTDIAAEPFSEKSPVDQLWSLYLPFMDLAEDLGSDFMKRFFISALNANELPFEALLSDPDNTTNKIAAAIIRKGQKEGCFKSGVDSADLLWLFNNGLQSIALKGCIAEEPLDNRAETRRLFELVFVERLTVK